MNNEKLVNELKQKIDMEFQQIKKLKKENGDYILIALSRGEILGIKSTFGMLKKNNIISSEEFWELDEYIDQVHKEIDNL